MYLIFQIVRKFHMFSLYLRVLEERTTTKIYVAVFLMLKRSSLKNL